MATLTKDRIMYIREMAEYAYSKAMIKNPTEMAKACGASISLIDTVKEPPAFCTPNRTLGSIYINKNVDKYSLQILCAHELGHLLIHRNNELCLFDTEIGPEEEYEANLFAYYLFPKAFVRMDESKLDSVEYVNGYTTNLVRFASN